jgi:hypothetical protein
MNFIRAEIIGDLLEVSFFVWLWPVNISLRHSDWNILLALSRFSLIYRFLVSVKPQRKS